jgi:ferritin
VSFRKSLENEVAEALNEQIKIEASAAFLYFSLASWANVRGLTGMASWFRVLDYQAKFCTIEAPTCEWDSPIAAFDMVRTQEHILLQRMNDLIDLADKHNDHLTHSFLTQFVPQQIADTAEADDVHDRLMLVGGDGHGLILIDQELGREAEEEG